MNRLGTAFVTVSPLLLTLLLAGCASSPAGEDRVARYTGWPRYRTVVNGYTNMPDGYKSYPLFRKDADAFRDETLAYLERVEYDLAHIHEASTEACNKIRAVADTIRGGYDLILSPVENTGHWRSGDTSNVENASGYPTFPDFDHKRPQQPTGRVGRTSWETYGEDLLAYEQAATAYIKDGNNFIRNCCNDCVAIQEIKEIYIAYCESLEWPDVVLRWDPIHRTLFMQLLHM